MRAVRRRTASRTQDSSSIGRSLGKARVHVVPVLSFSDVVPQAFPGPVRCEVPRRTCFRDWYTSFGRKGSPRWKTVLPRRMQSSVGRGGARRTGTVCNPATCDGHLCRSSTKSLARVGKGRAQVAESRRSEGSGRPSDSVVRRAAREAHDRSAAKTRSRSSTR